MCFDLLSNFCLKHFLFWEEFSDILSYVYARIYIKYRHSCRDLIKVEFSRQIFRENDLVLNFMKIRLVGAEFYPDRWKGGRTDGYDGANKSLFVIL